MTSKATIPPEFEDVFKVLEFGHEKYGDGWLTNPNAPKISHKENHDSMFHHLAQSFANKGSVDDESKLHHLLHLACRALMGYTLERRRQAEVDKMVVSIIEAANKASAIALGAREFDDWKVL